MSKKMKITIAAVVAVLVAAVVAFGVYVGIYYHADDAALAALATNEKITVEQRGDYVVFHPKEPSVGFIFYPGGKVEHTAYAPLMQALAERGVLCVLVEMPFRLAVLDVNAGADIPAQFPEIQDWYLGGHSLGGSMAAEFASREPGKFKGLALLAAYSTADLSDSGLKVTTVLGDQDQVLNMEKLKKNAENLPKTAIQSKIAGGNHAQFGSYGPQKGDGEAAIAPDEQIRITANLIVDMMVSP